MKQQIHTSDLPLALHQLIDASKSLRASGTPETYRPFLLNLHATIKVVLTRHFWQYLADIPATKQKEAFEKYIAILSVDAADSLEKWGEVLLHCNGGLSKEDVDTLKLLDDEYSLVSRQETGNLRINPDSQLCDKSLAIATQLGFLPELKPNLPSSSPGGDDFKATFVLVNLQKWRDSKISPPFYEKMITFAGKEQHINVPGLRCKRRIGLNRYECVPPFLF